MTFYYNCTRKKGTNELTLNVLQHNKTLTSYEGEYLSESGILLLRTLDTEKALVVNVRGSVIQKPEKFFIGGETLASQWDDVVEALSAPIDDIQKNPAKVPASTPSPSAPQLPPSLSRASLGSSKA